MARRIVNFALLLTVGILAALPWPAAACPFCPAVGLTMCDEIDGAAVAVIADLMRQGSGDLAPSDPDASKAEFRIARVIKGRELLGSVRSFRTLYFGRPAADVKFLAMAADKMTLEWATPIALSPRAWDYLRRMMELQRKGPERLLFAFNYLEDPDEMLRRDAYDEFAAAPYAVIRQTAPQLSTAELVARLRPTTAIPHLRLYCTLLGATGRPEHAELLQQIMLSKGPQYIDTLDAVLAAFLRLKGVDGLPLVDKMYLQGEPTDDPRAASAAINALRFQLQEVDTIPPARVLAIMRSLMSKPQMAGQVLADFARSEDWTVIDQAADVFVKSDGDNRWVREQVVGYLQACPLPQAKEQLTRLAKLDPDTVRRGNSFFPQDKIAGTAGGSTGFSQTDPTTMSRVTPARPGSRDNPAASGSAADDVTSDTPQSSVWQYGLPVAVSVAVVVLLGMVVVRLRGKNIPK